MRCLENCQRSRRRNIDENCPRLHGLTDGKPLPGRQDTMMCIKELLSKCEHKRLAIREFESGDDRRSVFLNRVLSVAMDTHPRRIVYEPDAWRARNLDQSVGTGQVDGS